MMALQELRIPGVSLIAVAPEVILSAGGLVLLVTGSFLKGRATVLFMSLLTLTGATVAAVLSTGRDFTAFSGAVVLDDFAVFVKLILLAVAAISILVSGQLLDDERAPAPEFLGLVMFATAGMMLMASASDLMLLFLALETFSLALYVLVAFRRGRADSQEGALKYFLMGSFSSAFFLYGIALVYGATGTTRLEGIRAYAREIPVLGQGLLAAGLALLLVGLAFKVAAVPFHMWTPDAYQGAPSPVAGFMAAGSKAAGFAALIRVLFSVFPSLVWDWRPVIVILSVISMVVGSVVAIVQTNVKRMLAYSAIAHSGFLLVGVASANSRGVSGALFYLGAYAVTVLGAFAVVYGVGRPGEPFVHIQNYRGLGKTRPFLAWTLVLFLASLAGIPPTAGFFAKFEVLSAAVSAGLTGLAVVAVVASAAAVFFYFRIIWLMFFEEPEGWAEGADQPATALPLGLAVILTAVAVAFLGIVPGIVLDLASSSLPGLP